MRKVALIRINYRALPATPRGDGRASTELIDDVMSRTLNPNDTDKLTPCS